MIEEVKETMDKIIKNTRMYEKIEHISLATIAFTIVTTSFTIYTYINFQFMNKRVELLGNKIEGNIEINNKINSDLNRLSHLNTIVNSDIKNIHKKLDLLLLSNIKIITFLESKNVNYAKEEEVMKALDIANMVNEMKYTMDYELINKSNENLPITKTVVRKLF